MVHLKDKILWLGACITIAVTAIVGINLYGAVGTPRAARNDAPGLSAQSPVSVPLSEPYRAS